MKKETYFIEVNEEGYAVNVYNDEDEAKNNLKDGDIVVEVKVVKRYKVVYESVQLAEIKPVAKKTKKKVN